MAFCSRLEHSVLALPHLSPGSSAGTAYSGYRLWERPDLPPPCHAQGLALRGQPKPQMYFERPLQYYLNLGFQSGFILDGFDDRAFQADSPQTNPLAWGGKFSEIPPAVIMRLRKM